MFSLENNACKYLTKESLAKNYETIDGYYATRIQMESDNKLNALSDEDFLTFLFLLLMQ